MYNVIIVTMIFEKTIHFMKSLQIYLSIKEVIIDVQGSYSNSDF